MIDLPPKPTGNSPEARFMRSVHDRLQSMRPQDVAGSAVKRTSRGFSLAPQPPRFPRQKPHFHPFKIYKSAAGLLPDDQSGTDPFNGGPLPRVSDAWRCFSIRGGAVEARPQFSVSTVLGTTFIGDMQFLVGVEEGADGTVGLLNHDYFSNRQQLDGFADGSLSFKLETVNIPNVGDVTVKSYTGLPGDELPHAARFVLNPAPDELIEIHASFWVELSDAGPSGFPNAKIKARMWSALFSTS